MEIFGVDISSLLVEVVIAALTVLAAVAVTLLSKLRGWVASKIGTENYNSALDVAKGLYTLLEDKYKSMGLQKAGLKKKEDMEKMLLQKFPKLTQVELDSINKRVWTMFNDTIDSYGVLEPINEVVEVEDDMDTEVLDTADEEFK